MRGIRRLYIGVIFHWKLDQMKNIPEGNGEFVRERPLPWESATEDEDEYDLR
jgi:hypothetical protein